MVFWSCLNQNQVSRFSPKTPFLPKGVFNIFLIVTNVHKLNKKNWWNDEYYWIQCVTLSVMSKSGLTWYKYYFKSLKEKRNVRIDPFERQIERNRSKILMSNANSNFGTRSSSVKERPRYLLESKPLRIAF
jgi:hypothetical protein